MPDEQVKVTVSADTKPYVRDMGKAADATDKIDKASNELTREAGRNAVKWAAVGTAITVAGAKAMAGINQAVDAASDLNESATKMRTIFGDAAGAIEEFSASSATSLGMSTQAAYDAASMMATFGKAAGLTGDDLSKFSTDMVTLSADLASFYNSAPEEAMEAIGAALRGEAEPIRRYGVLLDDATLKNRAMELGIISSIKNALTPQQRALAAQAEILAQTSDAQGDFARTSDGLANSQRQMDAAIQNAKAAFGESLLPVLAKGTKVAASMADALAGLPGPIRDTVAGLALVTAAVALLAPGATAVVKGLQGASGALKAYRGSAVAATAATDALTVSSSRLAGAGGLLAIAKAAGVVGVALAAIHAVRFTGGMLDDRRINDVADGFRRAADAGKDLGESFAVESVTGSITTVEAALAAATSGLPQYAAAQEQLRQSFAGLDAYLSSLSAGDASAAFDDLAGRVRASGGSVADLNGLLPSYSAAAKEAAGAAGEMADAETDNAKALDDANRAAQTAIDLLFGYLRARLAVSGSADALLGAEDRFADKLAANSKALEDEAKAKGLSAEAAKKFAAAHQDEATSLSRRTELGRENREAMRSEIEVILAHAQAVIDNAKANGDTTEEAYAKGRAAIEDGKDALIAAADAAGYSRDEVEKYVTKLTKIPKSVSTTVTAKFTSSGWGSVEAKLNRVNAANKLRANPGLLDETHAAGGKVRGMGVAGDGEWVIREDSARRYGDGFLSAVNAGTLSAAQFTQAPGVGPPPAPSHGMFFASGAVQVHEATASGVRRSVIDGLEESAYRRGVVR